MSVEGADFSQKSFEQRTLLRRKSFLEFFEKIGSRGLAFAGRVRLKCDEISDLGQELDVVLVAVAQAVRTKEIGFVGENDRAVAASFHPLEKLVGRNRRRISRFLRFPSDFSESGTAGCRWSNQPV
jgi:hypothetical protein